MRPRAMHVTAALAVLLSTVPAQATCDATSPDHLRIVPDDRNYCAKDRMLMARGCFFFCAARHSVWPKRIGYAVLGDAAGRFTGAVDTAATVARKVTGREVAASQTPDLVIFIVSAGLTKEQADSAVASAKLQLSPTVRYVLPTIDPTDSYSGRDNRSSGGEYEAGDVLNAKQMDDDEIVLKIQDIFLDAFDIKPTTRTVTDDRAP